MSAAWHAFATWGAPAPPAAADRLRDARRRRAAARRAARRARRAGGAIHDPLAWFDVSSYGPLALDAMIRAIGIDRLLYGSDRPVAAPPAPERSATPSQHALTRHQPRVGARPAAVTVAVLA